MTRHHGKVTAAENDAAASTTGASVISGGLWTAAAFVLPQLFVLAESIVAARYLGPDGMGRQSFIAWAQITLIALCTGGLPQSLMRHVGETMGRRQAGSLRGLIRWAWGIEIFGALVGLAVMTAAGTARADLRTAWILAGLACASGILHNVPSALLVGTQQWRAPALIGLATGGAGLAASIAVLAAGGGIAGMFAVSAAASFVNLCLTTVVARRVLKRVAPVAGPVGDLRRRVGRYAALATLQVVFHLIVWRRSEFLFLERYSVPSEIAMYSIAFAAITALARLPDAFGAVLSPAVATLYGGGEIGRIRSGFSRTLRLLLVITLPMAAGVAAIGPMALSLVYGPTYRRAGGLLVVLAVVFPLVPIARVAESLLQGVGQVRMIIAADIAATVVNISLALTLVPRHGAMGAALANAGAQATAASLCLLFASRAIGASHVLGPRWPRALAAAAATGLGGWLGSAWIGGVVGLVAGVALGSIGLTLSMVLLRVLGPDDVRWLGEHAGHHLGGRVGRALSLVGGHEAR